MNTAEHEEIESLVKTQASRIRRKYSHAPSLQDLVQEGWVASLTALRTYDEEKGLRKPYIARAVWQHLTCYVSRSLLPVHCPNNGEYKLIGSLRRTAAITNDAPHGSGENVRDFAPVLVDTAAGIPADTREGFKVSPQQAVLIEEGMLLVERLDHLCGKQRTQPLKRLEAVCARLDECK